jgi:hypothetical protein
VRIFQAKYAGLQIERIAAGRDSLRPDENPQKASSKNKRVASVPALEKLDFPLVLLRRFARLKRSQIAPFAGLGVDLYGIETVFAGLEFPDHGLLLRSKILTLQGASALLVTG